MKFFMVVAFIFIINGCSSIQDNYKPLYQVTPEKEAIKEKGKQ